MDGIVTRSLRKSFPVRDRLFGRSREHVAVDGLTLTVPPGSVTGLLGLNGAGKTTTIKVLATLLRPTSGTVAVDGLDVVTQARDVRRRINLIAGGERMVYARMTGRENLRYFGLLYGVPTKVLHRRVDELLDLVGLTDAGDTVVERYSRGMTQRLSIARGLVNDPAYLLLDEPTLGLDAPVARDLRRVVASLAAQGKGVLLTSHYLTEVEELCANVYVIAGGRHLAEGTPAQLTAATGGNRTVRVTVARHCTSLAAAVAEFADRLGVTATCEPDEEGGVVVSLGHPDDVAGPLVTAIVAAGGAVTGLELGEPSLEDAIIALAGGAPEPVVV
ncbi:ATP-binding cassette domain-containing protein [Saccharothrix isguenensis]